MVPPVDMGPVTSGRTAAGLKDSPESRLIGAAVADNPELAHAASPLSYLDALQKGTPVPPFLVMHGNQDTWVARGQSARLFDALLAKPEVASVEFVLLSDGTHGGGAFNEPAAIERVVDFLKNAFEMNL